MSDPDDKYQWNPGASGGQASDLSSGLHSATTFQAVTVGAPSVACKNVHWISVKLVRQPLKARPKWWPTPLNIPSWLLTPQNLPYGGEAYSADITTGKKTGALNGDGVVRFDNIPAGNCQFKFVKFYDDIEKYFKDKLAK